MVFKEIEKLKSEKVALDELGAKLEDSDGLMLELSLDRIRDNFKITNVVIFISLLIFTVSYYALFQLDLVNGIVFVSCLIKVFFLVGVVLMKASFIAFHNNNEINTTIVVGTFFLLFPLMFTDIFSVNVFVFIIIWSISLNFFVLNQLRSFFNEISKEFNVSLKGSFRERFEKLEIIRDKIKINECE